MNDAGSQKLKRNQPDTDDDYTENPNEIQTFSDRHVNCQKSKDKTTKRIGEPEYDQTHSSHTLINVQCFTEVDEEEFAERLIVSTEKEQVNRPNDRHEHDVLTWLLALFFVCWDLPRPIRSASTVD